MKGTVYGIGISDANYVVRTSTWRCPIYNTWANMIGRCYSEKYQATHPTYADCSVCQEWLTFSNFKAWMEEQDWQGKELDKDLLVSGNKVYGTDTCIFVYKRINLLLGLMGLKKGLQPIGVTKHRTKYQAACKDGEKSVNLGLFLCSKQAHRAWQIFKIKIIKEVALLESDKRLASAMLRIADKIKSDYDLNIETTHY
jgi:hypothetical protein